jgi:hypothetical protein
MKSIKKILLTLLFIIITVNLFGQVLIFSNPNDQADQSAMLEIRSTSKGLLPPSMTAFQRNMINNPASGLIIYCNNCEEFPVLQMQNNFQMVDILTAPLSTANSAPTATNVFLQGNTVVASALIASYVYSDFENNPQGNSIFQWYRADNVLGLNEIAIPNSNNLTYTIQNEDVGKYLRFSIIPKATIGTNPGVEVKSNWSSMVGSGPLALNVTQNGEITVGKVIIGSYQFFDYLNLAEGNSVYQWYRADDSLGLNEVVIFGANSINYILQPADEGKYLRFSVTPYSNDGVRIGLETKSIIYTGPIKNAPPVAKFVTQSLVQDNQPILFSSSTTQGINNLSKSNHSLGKVINNGQQMSTMSSNGSDVQEIDLAYIGSNITGNYAYTDLENNPESQSKFKWYQAEDSDGLNEIEISGETSIIFTAKTSNVNKFVRFSIIPCASAGSSPGIEVKSSYMHVVLHSPPVANNLLISGSGIIGQELTANYSYFQAESVGEGASIIKWYRCTNLNGDGEEVIADANTLTYTIQQADQGKYLRFSVTPMAISNTYPGIEVKSTIFSTQIQSTAPIAQNVSQSGNASVSSILTGSYTYYSAQGLNEGNSVYQWYRADNNSGLNEIAISGANSINYNIQYSDIGKFIRFSVTPVSQNSILLGQTVKASTFVGPIVNIANSRTIGTHGANYATLKLAFDAINSGAIKGSITLQVIDSTLETTSAILNASGTGNSNYTSVYIYPINSGFVIGGNLNAPLVDLSGADNVTIDGRVNSEGNDKGLILTNSNTGTSASVIRFIKSAENNVIKYCTLKGSVKSTTRGVVLFSTASTGNGNDGNIIENNNITGDVSGRPYNAIVFYGSTGYENSGNKVLNNNIYDFLNLSSSSNGIFIGYASNDNLIAGNSFYETTNFSPTAAVVYNAIRISSLSNNKVSGNFIGGSAPHCAGSPWTVNSNFAHYFCGIFAAGSSSIPSIVENNEIKNINYTSTEDNPWDGIFINTGNVDVKGNTIGATSGNNSIVVNAPLPLAKTTIVGGVVSSISIIDGGSGYTTAPVISFSSNSAGTAATAIATVSGGVITSITITNGGSGYTTAPSVYFDGQTNGYSTSHGMIQNSAGIVNIKNNNIGSITTTSSNYYSHGFESIYVRGVAGTLNISDNLIGSLWTSNSIYTSSPAIYSIIKQDVYGIYSSGIGTTIISGNTISNLTNAYAGTIGSSRTRGISTIAGTNSILNNIVRNISSPSAQTGTKSSAAVIGISQSSTTAATTQTVNGNTVYDINSTSLTAKVSVYGIYYSGPVTGDNFVTGNFVHDLSILTSDLGSEMDGILLYNGLTTCANNIITLGNNVSIGCKINGIWDESSANCNSSIYFNTVFISGNITSGATSSTSALWNAANYSIRNYRNNMLVNTRSGGVGGVNGKHYAIRLAGITGLTIDFNNYFVNGSNGVIGYLTSDKTTISTFITATHQDINSLNLNPNFVGGNTIINYYLPSNFIGNSIAGINIDYEGINRKVNPKIGALETNK